MFAISPHYNLLLPHADFPAVKAYLHQHGFIICQDNDPINALLEACGCITPEMAKGWFRHAGYIQ